MKTLIKRNLLSVFAVLLALGTMSFKLVSKEAKSATDPVWYYIPNTAGQESDVEQYRPFNGESCPGSASVICTIQAPDDGGKPDLGAAHSPTYKF